MLADNTPAGTTPTVGDTYANTTVTNVSPLLLYTPQILWAEAPPNDPMLSSYATGSYHYTNATSGKASVFFSWTGTGIWIYGGYRTRLGPYQVNLDGQVVTNAPGFQIGDQEQADALLYGVESLASTKHTVELINISDNAQQNVLDIDYLVFESEWNNGIATTKLDNTSSQWSYTSSDGTSWQNGVTESPVGSVTLGFTGEAIAVYGTLSSTQAPFTVTLDSGQPQSFLPNTRLNMSDQLLYFMNGLSQMTHSLVIYNNPNGLIGNQSVSLSVDYAFASTSNSVSTAHSSKRNNIIVGSSIGTGVVVILLMYLATRWVKRRKRSFRDRAYSRSPRPFLTSIPSPGLSSHVRFPSQSETIDIVASYSDDAADGSHASFAVERSKVEFPARPLPTPPSVRMPLKEKSSSGSLPSSKYLERRPAAKPHTSSSGIVPSGMQLIQIQPSLPPPYHMVRHRL